MSFQNDTSTQLNILNVSSVSYTSITNPNIIFNDTNTNINNLNSTSNTIFTNLNSYQPIQHYQLLI